MMKNDVLIAYCLHCEKLDESNVNKIYHDQQYGYPVKNDNLLFERLVLEINQAGLSWNTILLKQENFRAAFEQFSIERVASYGETEINRLLSDAGIVRNRLKINVAIYNAQEILKIKKEFGSFYAWLEHNHPKTIDEWVKIFKKKFKFVGGEIVNEFLMSIGFLDGAHCAACPTRNKIIQKNPKWLNV